VLSDIELLRGLCAVVPGLTPSDCGFLVKFLAAKCGAGGAGGAPASTAALAEGIASAAVADWFTAQPGGVERARGAPDADEEPAAAAERLTDRATKLAQFRAGWEARHGAAARKEAALDAAVPAEGPTWTRAAPEPFRVLHLAAAPPPSPAV